MLLQHVSLSSSALAIPVTWQLDANFEDGGALFDSLTIDTDLAPSESKWVSPFANWILVIKTMRSVIFIFAMLPHLAMGAQIVQDFSIDLEYTHTGTETLRSTTTESATYMLFDSTLGDLDSVEFTGMGLFGSNAVSVRNLSEQEASIYISPEVNLSWTVGPGLGERMLYGFDNSGSTKWPTPSSPQWQQSSGGSVTTSGGDFLFSGNAVNHFLGSGWHDAAPTWDSNIFVIAEPGTEFLIDMTVQASYRISYNYTPAAVPIPAALWFFGSALASLSWMRRKQSA